MKKNNTKVSCIIFFFLKYIKKNIKINNIAINLCIVYKTNPHNGLCQ